MLFTMISVLAATMSASASAAAGEIRAKDPDQMTSLGITVRQLDEADVIGPNGEDLGDVEYVLRNEAGEISAIVVELDDDRFGKDRLVRLPLATGLTVREEVDFDRDDWDEPAEYDLVTSHAVEALKGMPDYAHPRAGRP